MSKRSREMTVIACIADMSTANGVVLRRLMDEHEKQGGVKYVTGNDVSCFQSEADEIEVVMYAVFAGGKSSIIKELWAAMPRLKWVHALSAGVDALVPVLRECDGAEKLPVSNAKGAFSESLGEWFITAFIYFNKQIQRIQQNRENKVWDKFIMSELRGKTVGFVGFGSIAQSAARLCRCFGMKTIAVRRSKEGPGGELADEVFTYDEDKLAVFKQADYVVCSLPGTPTTEKFCGAAEFAAMSNESVFVSIGRGVCVDEDALVDALKSNSIRGAALDVFRVEPLPQESGLWDCDNLLMTAHNADNTCTYMEDSWGVFLTNYASFVKGEEFPTISLEHGY